MEIQYPPLITIKQGEDYEFQFHVFNKSNGLSVNNATTFCKFHLYNNTGYELVDEDLIMASNLIDYQIIIKGGNFSNGYYSYIVQCNSSILGGFDSVPFEVTSTGTKLTESKSILYIGLLAILYSHYFQLSLEWHNFQHQIKEMKKEGYYQLVI